MSLCVGFSAGHIKLLPSMSPHNEFARQCLPLLVWIHKQAISGSRNFIVFTLC